MSGKRNDLSFKKEPANHPFRLDAFAIEQIFLKKKVIVYCHISTQFSKENQCSKSSNSKDHDGEPCFSDILGI